MNELARAASFFARDLASWKRALVCFVSSSVLSTFAAAEQDSRGSILHETWEQTYPVSENLTLSVQNTDGRIYIYGSDDNQLTVTAVKRSFTQERMDVISIQVAVEGNAAGDGDTASSDAFSSSCSRGWRGCPGSSQSVASICFHSAATAAARLLLSLASLQFLRENIRARVTWR
jgi:hypothetical protein